MSEPAAALDLGRRRTDASTVGAVRSRTNRWRVNGSSTLNDPLAAVLPDLYSCSVPVQRWLRRNRTLVILAAIVVSLSAIGATLFTHNYLVLLHNAFQNRSLAYAHAFAAAAQPWADRSDVGMLRSASQLLLAGSAIYVQIAREGEFLIDERNAGKTESELGVVADPVSSVRRVSRTTGGSHLDIVIPLPLPEDAERASADTAEPGYIRIGIDCAGIVAQANGTIVIASGGAIGFDLVMVLVLFLALRGRRRDGDPSTFREAPVVAAGPLEVDLYRKSVRLEGRSVHLTPKQFALVELLSSEPGRVFSEREILAAAWPDSPYADAKDVKQYVYLVRQRLSEIDTNARRLIVTVPGFGYRLAVEDVDPELT